MSTRQSAKRAASRADLDCFDGQTILDPDSQTYGWKWLDKKLSKQNSYIDDQVAKLQSHLKQGELRIMDTMKSLIQDAENRILSELDKRFCEFREELNDVTERVSKLESVAVEVVSLKNEIKQFKIQSAKHSNSLVACDLRINGVPFMDGENLYKVFDIICKEINLQTPPLQSIFRLQNKNNKLKDYSPDAVIIVKLTTPYDKNSFLKSLNAYKKENKTNLKLSILGFTPAGASSNHNNSFYIYENLTSANFKILRAAVRLKKQNIIHSAYSYRGLVYVKRLISDKPTCIDHMDELNNFFRDHDSGYPKTTRAVVLPEENAN